MAEPQEKGAVSWAVGDKVFLASGGVSTVRAYASRTPDGKPGPWNPTAPPDFYVVESDDKVACVPVTQASAALRPLVQPAEAEQQLSILRGPEVPLSQEPLLERGKRVAHSGSPEEHAQFLRELYALPVPLSDALVEGLKFYEQLVLRELETVLSLSPGTLHEEMASRYKSAEWVRRPLTR